MTREIKFRGKRKDNQEWVFGYYFDGYILNYIDAASTWYSFIDKSNDGPSDHNVTCRAYEVIPETVGQYTGIKDSNGIEVFDNDIVQYDHEDGIVVAQVKWVNNTSEENMWLSGFKYEHIKTKEREEVVDESVDFLVLGNIHDNSFLLNQQ